MAVQFLVYHVSFTMGAISATIGKCSLGLPEGFHGVSLRYELQPYEVQKKMRCCLRYVDSCLVDALDAV
jgi:hypothetical protein